VNTDGPDPDDALAVLRDGVWHDRQADRPERFTIDSGGWPITLEVRRRARSRRSGLSRTSPPIATGTAPAVPDWRPARSAQRTPRRRPTLPA